MDFNFPLVILSLFTSSVAGVFGLGGGMLLIAVMPPFIASNAIIPVHSTTQLASNLSRAWFSKSHIQWQFLNGFLVGSMCGLIVFGLVIVSIDASYIPIAIGIYILLSLWSDLFQRLLGGFENFFTIGFFQTGLGAVVGATGPLTTALLSKKCTDKNQIVATNALFMFLTHTLKISLFIWLGFQFSSYLTTILGMVMAAVLGSWLGTQLRQKVSHANFSQIMKWSLTVLALQMLLTSVFF